MAVELGPVTCIDPDTPVLCEYGRTVDTIRVYLILMPEKKFP